MKAKEILEKYKITRRTLTNWVKKGLIRVEKTPSCRYIYFEKNNKLSGDSKYLIENKENEKV